MNLSAQEDGIKIADAKTPVTRLLDLLAGWSEFVQSEEDAVPDHQISIQRLCDLYQEAGELMEVGEPNQEESAVRECVERRVIPALLGKQ